MSDKFNTSYIVSTKKTKAVASLSKEESQICDMFNEISAKYDFLNKVFSLGIGSMWRKKLVRHLKSYNPRHVLDTVTGTGNLAIKIAKIKPMSITAIDFSEKMIELGQKKIRKRRLDRLILFKTASCNNLPFSDGSFDAVTNSFGIRNNKDPLKALKQMHRVLKDDGVMILLEFGMPKNFFVRVLFLFYFTGLLPFVGGVLTGKRGAYSYLTSSVKEFPYGKDFIKILEEAGFAQSICKKCTFGVTYLYIARKNKS